MSAPERRPSIGIAYGFQATRAGQRTSQTSNRSAILGAAAPGQAETQQVNGYCPLELIRAPLRWMVPLRLVVGRHDRSASTVHENRTVEHREEFAPRRALHHEQPPRRLAGMPTRPPPPCRPTRHHPPPGGDGRRGDGQSGRVPPGVGSLGMVGPGWSAGRDGGH